MLAWEPFDRLLGHFFPEMFYDEAGRFYPYTPIEAFGATVVLMAYAAVPIAVILLVVGTVRSVRKNGTEKTVTTVEKGVEATAVGIVTVLSALATAMFAVAGFAAREVAASTAEDDDVPSHGYYHPSMSFVAGGIPHTDLGLPIDNDGNPMYDFDDDLKG